MGTPLKCRKGLFPWPGLPPIDLIRSPLGSDVLSDFWAGAWAGTGDLVKSLEGWVTRDRDLAVASGTNSVAIGEWTIPMEAADGVKAEAGDSLFTSAAGFFAELSTMLLRWRPEGRCAASWITSETVSGDRKTMAPASTAPLFH